MLALLAEIFFVLGQRFVVGFMPVHPRGAALSLTTSAASTECCFRDERIRASDAASDSLFRDRSPRVAHSKNWGTTT
jgi:hypothetical protein